MAIDTKGLKRKRVGIITRRRFIKSTVAAAVAAGTGNILFPTYGRAKSKRLTILQWNHFIRDFDKWFKEVYAKQWGNENDTEVVVENIPLSDINARAAQEASSKKGHDLVLFPWPKPDYENYVIDHREIYEECEKLVGKPVELAVRSTYNPLSDKFYGFSDSFVPNPINYRKDLWDDVGITPDSWDDILRGGAKIKKKHNIPLGIGLASEMDCNMALRAIMYSFGASVQDAEGNLVLNSKNTLECLNFVKELYQQCMTPDVLTWDSSSNNHLMISGQGSLAVNDISITRTAEKRAKEMAKKIWLAKAAKGPVRRMGVENFMSVYVIWKFAKNMEGAKKFLIDYTTNFEKAFVAGQYYNFPCFPKTVPDLNKLISNDPLADPPDKYKVLDDVADWTTNIGYPGSATAAIAEIHSTWLIPGLFKKVATGDLKPAEALKVAEKKAQRIFWKWRAKGLA